MLCAFSHILLISVFVVAIHLLLWTKHCFGMHFWFNQKIRIKGKEKKHTQPNEWKEITRCAFHYMRYFVVWLCFENKIIHVIRFWIFFLCHCCCCCLFSLHSSMEHCKLLLSFFVARFLILNIVVIRETSFPVYFFNFPFFVAEDFIDSQR